MTRSLARVIATVSAIASVQALAGVIPVINPSFDSPDIRDLGNSDLVAWPAVVPNPLPFPRVRDRPLLGFDPRDEQFPGTTGDNVDNPLTTVNEAQMAFVEVSMFYPDGTRIYQELRTDVVAGAEYTLEFFAGARADANRNFQDPDYRVQLLAGAVDGLGGTPIIDTDTVSNPSIRPFPNSGGFIKVSLTGVAPENADGNLTIQFSAVDLDSGFDTQAFLDDVSLSSDVNSLQAGDVNQDLNFDQFDLLQVQFAGKFLTGLPATWGEGDWDGAPGGQIGDPPTGDGLFNQTDIMVALESGVYRTGPYAATASDGMAGDAQTSLGYNPVTGEVFVDAPLGMELTSINIDSAAAIFTGEAASNLGGSFDNDADGNVFKATFGGSFGTISFGRIAQNGLSRDFLLADLTVVGSIAGGGSLGEVDLIYVPEPANFVLMVLGTSGVLFCRLAAKNLARHG